MSHLKSFFGNIFNVISGVSITIGVIQVCNLMRLKVINTSLYSLVCCSIFLFIIVLLDLLCEQSFC